MSVVVFGRPWSCPDHLSEFGQSVGDRRKVYVRGVWEQFLTESLRRGQRCQVIPVHVAAASASPPRERLVSAFVEA